MSLLETKEKNYTVTVEKQSTRTYRTDVIISAIDQEEVEEKALEISNTLDTKKWELDDESFEHSVVDILEDKD